MQSSQRDFLLRLHPGDDSSNFQTAACSPGVCLSAVWMTFVMGFSLHCVQSDTVWTNEWRRTNTASTHNGVLALVSSAQLCVGGVLHIEHPAAHQHSQPCKEQVLHPNKGDSSLRRGSRDRNTKMDPHLKLILAMFMSLLSVHRVGVKLLIYVSRPHTLPVLTWYADAVPLREPQSKQVQAWSHNRLPWWPIM